MLQYLIILLDDTSISFCHYENTAKTSRLIPIQMLRDGILFGMKENLMIQFVFPDYELSSEYKDVIETIDHSKIVSSLCEDGELKEDADVIVFHDWKSLEQCVFDIDKLYALRTTKDDFFDRYRFLKNVLGKVVRLNIVLTDVERFGEKDFAKYKQILQHLSDNMITLYKEGKSPQLNILTDIMMLDGMNNCNAGCESITLAPDGKFYVCPAFYYEQDSSIGSLADGPDIKNPQLYKLAYAPICRHCDAYQCRRCVWLNKKMTLEVNTPSHEQCVLAHLERNASRDLLERGRELGEFLPEKEIKEIDYLDPFDKRKEWEYGNIE
ncbi:MAG: CXXX repeat peptide maturase [Prevotella sp.]|nr:CXXX repeat peptide maturase [Prevotella sp.]